MAAIQVLPKQIAELIAAGEVVERPASVVKELLENAIDAGASAITAEIRNGGVSYIRVTDNGSGIAKEDVPKAFLSHATSKVRKADDLDEIMTLGFRGEALASIAAVSHVELLTRQAGENTGTSYAISGGTQERCDDAGCPLGTTIVVRDLFYNTPARMKFLKKDVSEANAVADVVERLALSHPEVSIRFIREGKQTLITPGDNQLLSVIYSVFGRVFAEGLLPVSYTLDGVEVHGFVSRPTAARPSRSMQYFFLNNRTIRSRALAASMENAYKNAIMIGKFPACVLHIGVPARLVDVNVHPAKTEVRFSDERRVGACVYYAVRSAIDADVTRPKADLAKAAQKTRQTALQLQMVETDTPPAAPQKKSDFWANMPARQFKNEDVRPRTTPAAPQGPVGRPAQPSVVPIAAPPRDYSARTEPDEPDVIGAFRKKQQSPPQKQPAPQPPAPAVTVTAQQQPRPLRLIGEAFKTYILCEYDGKLYVIDKHAAHERILFNKLRETKKDDPRQVLLTPVQITLSKEEYNCILTQLDTFEACGFLIEDFGNNCVVARECPMLLHTDDVQDVVLEIAQNLLQHKTDIQAEKINRIYETAACKAAIKAGNKNSTAELKALAEQVLYHNEIRYCPHGRPVLIEMSRYDLEKQFGRIQ
jgi:DNA mismatch repair protein MutL